MTLPVEIIRRIAIAVEKQGGDMDDVDDLVEVWARLHVDPLARVDRLRYEAARPVCRCADGGKSAPEPRCQRCHGITAHLPGGRP